MKNETHAKRETKSACDALLLKKIKILVQQLGVTLYPSPNKISKLQDCERIFASGKQV